MSRADRRNVIRSLARSLSGLTQPQPGHALHGVTLAGADHKLDIQAWVGRQLPAEAELRLTLEELKDFPQIDGELIWQLTEQGERYRTHYELVQGQGAGRQWLKVDCEGKGVFAYRDNSLGIHWDATGTGPGHYLQTLGLAVWLEQRQRPCIHANALHTDAGVIGLIAPSRSGKTTLSMQLVEQGAGLMTDDMLVLHPHEAGEWRVYPAAPKLRLWPDSAAHFVGRAYGDLERVHQRFEKRCLPLEQAGAGVARAGALKCLYLLNRQDEPGGAGRADCRIEAVPPAQALMTLMQNSILADAYRALGIEDARMQQLARLLDGIPLRRVTYPSGFDQLPGVAQRLREDIAALK